MERIYLGPMGQLVALDIPTGGYTHDFVEYGAEHVPLSGLRTKDIVSLRHEFKIGTDGLTPRALAWFRMLYTEAIAGPLYLRETTEKNLLRARLASSSSTVESLPTQTDWTLSGVGDTAVSVAATNLLLPSAVVGEELTPAPSRALSWFTNGSSRTIADPVLTPVLPGEKLCFSTYVQSGATVTLEIVPYNAVLAPQTAITGTTTVAGTPTRKYIGYTVPTNGTIVAVTVQVRQATTGTAVLHAVQLEGGTLTPTAWTMGLGVPKVMFTEHAAGERHPIGPYTNGSYSFKQV